MTLPNTEDLRRAVALRLIVDDGVWKLGTWLEIGGGWELTSTFNRVHDHVWCLRSTAQGAEFVGGGPTHESALAQLVRQIEDARRAGK